MARKKPMKQEPAQPQLSVEEIEEQNAIELPAREAFSLVFSSPTFLQAGNVIEQTVPEDPAPEVPPPA
jgi:hypothetical protein